MRTAWILVGLLWAVAVLNYLDRQLVANMARPIKSDLDIRDAQFGLFSTVFLLVYGICSPFAGYLADRVGRKPVIITSLALWSVATLLTGYVTEYWQMITARVLLGVSEAFYMPAAVALIVDYHAGRTRSRATGLHLSGVYVGSVLGGLGGWFAEEHGWRFAFRLFGAVGVFYALVLVVVLRVKDVHEANPDREGGGGACNHPLPHGRGSPSQYVVPVCYEFAPDLPRVCEHTNLIADEVIRLHTATEFTVYAVGFALSGSDRTGDVVAGHSAFYGFHSHRAAA
jgi:MFS family permease